MSAPLRFRRRRCRIGDRTASMFLFMKVTAMKSPRTFLALPQNGTASRMKHARMVPNLEIIMRKRTVLAHRTLRAIAAFAEAPRRSIEKVRARTRRIAKLQRTAPSVLPIMKISTMRVAALCFRAPRHFVRTDNFARRLFHRMRLRCFRRRALAFLFLFLSALFMTPKSFRCRRLRVR